MTDGLNTHPYWWEAAAPQVLPQVPVAETCDIAIVGTGYAGLSAALVLARAGRSVQVFDKHRPDKGASSRNGGQASDNIHIGFGKMIKTMGLETALSVYGEAKAAREGLAAFIAAENIDCDYQPIGRFTGAMRPSYYEAQGREADRLNKHFDIDAEMIRKSEQHREIGSDLYHGGMVRPNLAGLMEAAIKAGVTIHGETAVNGIRRDRGAFEIDTARRRVKSGQAIVATNGYTDNADRWLRRCLVPVPSRMIATQPLPPETMARLMPKRRMLGKTRQLYHYFRPSPDGTRILFGGRERAWGGAKGEFAINLRADLAEIYPELTDVPLSHTWFGFVAYNLDYLPRLFERDGVHYATGFCGSAVVWAWWIASKLAFKLIGDAKAETPLPAHRRAPCRFIRERPGSCRRPGYGTGCRTTSERCQKN